MTTSNLSFSDRLEELTLYIALLAAWVAMLGSLYLSEVAGFIPCTLCWYQRILMYPFSLVIAAGILRRDENLVFIVLPLSLLGMAVSSYHYLLQKTDIFDASTTCTVGDICTTIWFNWFGFVTIPFLALIAFTIITLMILVADNVGLPNPDAAHTPWLPVLGTIGIAFVGLFLLLFVGNSQTVESPPPASIDGAAPKLVVAETESSAVASLDGEALYTQACAVCHGLNGEGVAGLGFALAGSELFATNSDEELIALIREGISADDPRNRTGVVMPPSGGRPDLSDAELVAILAYLRLF